MESDSSENAVTFKNATFSWGGEFKSISDKDAAKDETEKDSKDTKKEEKIQKKD